MSGPPPLTGARPGTYWVVRPLEGGESAASAFGPEIEPLPADAVSVRYSGVVAIADTAPGTPAQPVMVTLSHEVDLTNADSVGEQLATACAPPGAP